MDQFIQELAIKSRELMVADKRLNDLVWQIDSLVSLYAQERAKEEQVKFQAKQGAEKKVSEAEKSTGSTEQAKKSDKRVKPVEVKQTA